MSAMVDGHEAWIESDSIALDPASEAFASAILIPALRRQRHIEVEAPVDPVWLENMAPLTAILHRWWRYPRHLPIARPGALSPPSAARETTLFFSGGTDSFYSLLRGHERPDRLLLVQGFDYDLDEGRRHEGAVRTLQEVAEASGVLTAVIRTNLRQHPLFTQETWERAHGGAMACVGHALGEPVRRVAISSSISYEFQRPWGSHWTLDPLWSSSRRTFVSVGHHLRKFEKLRDIAGEPIVQRHLRVCWRNVTPEGNCNRCHKCLYARLVLHECGQLPRFRTLAGPESLVEDLDALPKAGQRNRTYEVLLESDRLEPEVRRAVRELLARTRKANGASARLKRTVRRKMIEWVKGAAS